MNWMTRENSFRVSLSGSNNMGDLTLAELKNTFGHHHEYKPEKKNTLIKCLKTNSLTLLTIAGVVGGVGLGFIMRSSKHGTWPARQILYVNFAGDLFLRILKALILPLIFSSLISAIGSLDLKLSGRIGVRAVGYYLATTICAVILGIIIVVIVHPGKGHTGIVAKPSLSRNVTTVDTLMDLFRNMFPPNLIQACTHQYRTVLVPPATGHAEIFDWQITHEYVPGMNILGLVVFSTAFGIAIGKLGPPVEPLLILFQSLSSLMMLITNWVIWLSPLGILFLVSSKILEMDSFESTIGQLGMYFMTVLLGLGVHAFVVLPIMYFVITKRSPIKFVLNMSQALATAFGTASSSATLPIAISCLEERNDIDPRVARFVMPIGATINMDGTALYEAVAAIFIAQTRGMSLSLGNLVAISITATAASIGAAGIPQAGLVTMVMVLDTVGLPAEDVTLIIAVDWLLDRFRTTINVMGDSLGAGIVNHLSKIELNKSII